MYGKGKAIHFTSPRTSSGQASRPHETVPIRTISNLSGVEGNPKGKSMLLYHQVLAVKGERHAAWS